MPKSKIGPKLSLYPMPTTLVGALVDGKPNYITIAHVGILDFGHISLGMAKMHYTNAGIKENQTFSVNIPSVNLVEKTDYCGLVTGKNTDKSQLFEAFYGELETAPMIKECPVNMECRLVQTVDLPKHDVFVGQIIQTYCDEEFLTEGQPDISRVQPLLFTMNDTSYWSLGQFVAKAWQVGKNLKSK